jgi:hypothetical protein
VANDRVPVLLVVLALVATACASGPRSYSRSAYFKGGRLSSSTLLLHRETTYSWSTPERRWGFDIVSDGEGGTVRVDHRYFELSLASGRCREVTGDVFARSGGDRTPREEAAAPVSPPAFEVIGKSSLNDIEGVVVRIAGGDWEYGPRTRTRWTFPAPPVSQPAWASPISVPSEGWLPMGSLADNGITYQAVGVVDQKLVVRRLWDYNQHEDVLELRPATGPVVWFEGTLLTAGDGWVHDLASGTKLEIPRGKVDAIPLHLNPRDYVLRIQPSDGPAIWKVLTHHIYDFVPPTGYLVDARGDTQVRLESAARTAWLYHRERGWRAISFDACYRIAPTWSDEVESIDRP